MVLDNPCRRCFVDADDKMLLHNLVEDEMLPHNPVEEDISLDNTVKE
jgi:hypothetical protein